MADIIMLFAALILGYVLGSFNTSVIVGRLYGKDIRSHGSKGAGLTNTFRVLGKSAAVLVLGGDVLKGVIACLVGWIIGLYFYSGDPNVTLLAAGVGAVIGHNWPVYFGFKGGKGVLTAGVVLFMANWVIGLICLGVFVTVVILTRYVSLGSICAAVLAATISFFPVFGNNVYFYVFVWLMAVMIVIRHMKNIQRLILGTENKLKLRQS